jgi:cell division protein FtsW (lipid II flippase)
MGFPKKISELCTPARIYFLISFIGIAIAIIQNFGNSSKYCLGMFTCNVPSVLLVFIFKIVYIFFWAWILNLMCKDGHSEIAWFLVIFPYVLLFVILGLLMIWQDNDGRRKRN